MKGKKSKVDRKPRKPRKRIEVKISNPNEPYDPFDEVTYFETGKKKSCYACPEIRFISDVDYLLHLQESHNGERIRCCICSQCGKMFGSTSELQNHTTTKCGTEYAFTCTVCGTKLKSQGSLYTHMLLHGEKNYTCKFCGKQFHNSHQMKAHEYIHTNDVKYRCEVCGRGFSHRQSIITHSSTHTGIKPYSCESCGKAFSCIGNLLKHRKTHATTCGATPMTSHSVKNDETRLKLRINTPATNKQKNYSEYKLNQLEKNSSKLAERAAKKNISGISYNVRNVDHSKYEEDYTGIDVIKQEPEIKLTVGTNNQNNDISNLTKENCLDLNLVKTENSEFILQTEDANHSDSDDSTPLALFAKKWKNELVDNVPILNPDSFIERDHGKIGVLQVSGIDTIDLNDNKDVELKQETEDSKMCCNVCNKTFKYKARFESHIKSHAINGAYLNDLKILYPSGSDCENVYMQNKDDSSCPEIFDNPIDPFEQKSDVQILDFDSIAAAVEVTLLEEKSPKSRRSTKQSLSKNDRKQRKTDKFGRKLSTTSDGVSKDRKSKISKARNRKRSEETMPRKRKKIASESCDFEANISKTSSINNSIKIESDSFISFEPATETSVKRKYVKSGKYQKKKGKTKAENKTTGSIKAKVKSRKSENETKYSENIENTIKIENIKTEYSDESSAETAQNIEANFTQSEIKPKRRRKRSNKERQQIECNICKGMFSGIKRLERHQQSTYSEDTGQNCATMAKKMIIKCDYCKELILRKNMREHKKANHAEILTCDICNKIFSKLEVLRYHRVAKHSAIISANPYEPAVPIPKLYTYVCDKCGAQYKHRSSLAEHVRTGCGTGPLFKCDLCDSRLHSVYARKTHMRTHQEEKSNLCTFCGRKFMLKVQLQNHLYTHTGEKPFKCPDCPKAFAHSVSLVTHSSLHTGIKRYLCLACGKRFSCTGNLIKHKSSKSCREWYILNADNHKHLLDAKPTRVRPTVVL